MSGKGLLLAFFFLPVGLLLGSIVGLSVGSSALIEGPYAQLIPPCVAGALSGAFPIFVVSMVSPDEPFWHMSLVLTALFVFLIVSLGFLFFPVFAALSRSFAMELPGFLFGAFTATTFTKSGNLVDRLSFRLLLIALLFLWIASDGIYFWMFAPIQRPV
ncbi:MAG: hypothetical protein PHE27_03335 [Alphaproteobacteria bacterium]|nr:hypothetical protein [Alphaproteobacteria bacterium]